ncbi:MAG: hypothetical protein IKU84_00055 [Clostridia bacterium]|nr:hypothetical protein [Clostridia bacterium]
MGFEKFSGNPRVRDYLTAAFNGKTVPHAFLISGSDEEEKRNLAKTLSGAIVCTGENSPCDTCNACKKAEAGIHPDIIWKECEGSSIKVDEIRAIRRDAYLLPNDGEKKVYVICDSDKMTQEAQDALLKILEEPPRFTTFILLCYNHNSLLTTVLSRVTHLKLMEKSESCGVDDETLESARAIVRAIGERSEIEILKAFIACEKKKRDEMHEIISCVTMLMRDGMVKSVSRCEMLVDDHVSDNISKISAQEIVEIMDVLRDARALILRNVGVAHVVAKCAVQISGALM